MTSRMIAFGRQTNFYAYKLLDVQPMITAASAIYPYR